MRKQKKQMIFVLVLLVLFGAAYGGMRIYNDKQTKAAEKEEEASKIYIADVKQDEITAFSYQNNEETLEFVKEGDSWISKNDESLQLDQSAIETMLDKIASLEAEKTIENPDELSAYGMDTPDNVITFTTENGTTTLRIGMENSITDQYYLTKNEETILYLVSSSFPSAFQKTLADLEDTSEAETETIEETTEAE